MAKVEMYTTGLCPFCRQAKMLLERKGVEYVEYPIDVEPGRRDEMLARSQGRRTVPQIFIDGKSVGGFDDLYDLNAEGKLDGMLGLSASA